MKDMLGEREILRWGAGLKGVALYSQREDCGGFWRKLWIYSEPEGQT